MSEQTVFEKMGVRYKPYEERLYEENLYDMEVKADSTDYYEDAGKESNSVLSVDKSDINEAVEGMHEDIYGELVSDAVMAEPMANVSERKAEAMRVTPEEKAKAVGFTGMRSFDTVVNVVQAMFYEMGHKAGIDEIMAEAKVLYEGMEKYVTGLRVAEILKDMVKMEISYSSLTDKEKVVFCGVLLNMDI